MRWKRLRVFLAATLLLLIAVAWNFYRRQNSGLQVGGDISFPKMLWLSYAIAAWFVLPPYLASDDRSGSGVRRLFASFWIAMMVRGVIELVLVYSVGHWSPWYGISHDLFCVSLIWVLRRRVRPQSSFDRRALRFAGSLVVALLIETAFAGIFLQSGAAAEGIYFASSDASWNFVNLLTLAALAFVLPDLGYFLASTYFPAFSGEAGRVLLWGRALLAAAVLLVISAGFATWTTISRAESRAQSFQDVGFGIYESCTRFNDDFFSGDEAAMTDFVVASNGGGDAFWSRLRMEQSHPFELYRWQPQGSRRSFLEVLLELRREHVGLEQAAFKIHLLDEVSSNAAVAQIRFEVTGARRTDYGLWRCSFESEEGSRWRVADCELIEGTTVEGPGNHFSDQARHRGLDFEMEPDRRFVPGSTCEGHDCDFDQPLRFQTMRHAYAGASAADIDGDGDDDLFLCAGGQPAVYRNSGGEFEDVTVEVGLGGLWHINTAGFADLDNDGDQDLFLGSFFGPNRLFENDGQGHFVEVSAQSGLGRDDMVTCFAYFDYDGDGDLDLYLGRFLDARSQIPGSFLYARNGERDVLYRNDGDLHFSDVTQEAGVGDVGLALALAAADYDADGDQDLYVANDFGRNVLYQNQGDGTFREVSRETGTFAVGGSMSASWGDYDNDGLLDLYVAAIRSNQRWFVQPVTARRVVLKYLREGRFTVDNPLLSDLRDYMGSDWMNIGNHALAGNSLLQQQPDGTFVDQAESAGARPAGWYWSSGFFDLDQDGDLDLFASNGWITGENSHDL